MNTLEPREAYALWAPHYDADVNPLLNVEERVVAGLIGSLARGRVVDIGCGTGRWRRHNAIAGRDYIGIDASFAMLRHGPPGKVAAADAAFLPLASETAGLVLCSLAVAYFPDLSAAFAEMARVVRRGGRVLVSDLDPETGWERTFRSGAAVYGIEHCRCSTAKVIEAAAEAGLELTRREYGSFIEADRRLFVEAGREDLFTAVNGIPAVWAAVWVRR